MLVTSCAHNHGWWGSHSDCSHMNCSNHQCSETCQHGDGMYDMHCAYSMSQGNYDLKGKNSYRWSHKGKTYYFSSEENKNNFIKDADKNINKADKYWGDR